MYMVPQSKPAPNAARMPLAARGATLATCCDVVAYAKRQAPLTIASPPPNTLLHCPALAPRSSLNSSHPQNNPIRPLVFHKGNAIESPTSRMAKTVSVLATAHSPPATMAHTIRCGFARRSRNTYRVPFKRVGTVQRATKTPATMASDITNGDTPTTTSLVGASAPPSQAPAARAQRTPSTCNDRASPTAGAATFVLMLVAMGRYRMKISSKTPAAKT